ncbi:hypothetical protein AAF712_008594 [Marasmius tenuissimus]|uniref:RRM domain-containing protein n=1 Tax=Marasmius tenuissimus TaxID=585030 RepID=A0ABR2ZT15_9AGAR
MYGHQRPTPYARYNSFHGPKQRVLGNSAANVPPAWRTPGQPGPVLSSSRSPLLGSKILLSQLPTDVGEKEVEELFKKTVGPLKDSFVIYNSAGKSKGMAVVSFQRPGDALVAQGKYDGKFVDGRRPIKIEIISDTSTILSSTSTPVAAPPQPPSLFDRIEKKTASTPTGPSSINGTQSMNGTHINGVKNNHSLPRQAAAAAKIAAGTPQGSTPSQIPIPPRRRIKKGPKRLKKQLPRSKTAEELDKEMEDYRAGADGA